jgi:hypothetical protein
MVYQHARQNGIQRGITIVSELDFKEQERYELSSIGYLVAIKGEAFYLDEFRTKEDAEKFIKSCQAIDKLYKYKHEYEIRLRSEN